MIINIRGTSGSGKSTLVRRVVDLYDNRVAVKVAGRKQPIGYVYSRKNGGRQLGVVGHYETDCGGCDTIANMDDIYNRVREAHGVGMDVLYEGLLISADANRAISLHTEGLPLLVIALDTPLDLCLSSVNQRRQLDYEKRLNKRIDENHSRATRGQKLLPEPEPKGDVNPKNTASKFSGVKSSMRRLQDAGVTAVWHSRDDAFNLIRQELNL